jgi:UDP:flavonoid glycosyltransferase YjiC (YdhE family)
MPIKVLVSWELGAGLGHISNLRLVATHLVQRGCVVTFAIPFQSLRLAQDWLLPLGNCIVAPVMRAELPHPAASMPEILMTVGFQDQVSLKALVQGWQSIFGLCKPDLVVTDFAPSAMLAAKFENINYANLGTGFSLPPSHSPFPSIRDWDRILVERLTTNESKVLSVINAVAKYLNKPLLNKVADLFIEDHYLLVTWQEFDHYQRSAPIRYFGAAFTDDAGAPPSWIAKNNHPKCFVYLKRETPQLQQVLKVLAKAPLNTICYLQGGQTQDVKEFMSEQLSFTYEPLHAGKTLEECHFVINNGGHGLVAAAALRAKPSLMLAITAEQYLLARRLDAAGLGHAVTPQQSQAGFKSILDRFRSRDWSSLSAFANKYAGQSLSERGSALADRCFEIAAKRA